MMFLTIFSGAYLTAQTETMSSGSFIIDMGGNTRNNALRPYGMIYDLLENYQVPIKWVINPTKSRNGTDFTYNGVNYRGGPFIIQAEFRTATINSRIAFWQGQGVNGVTTTAPIDVPVYTTILNAPSWTRNAENNDIIGDFFNNANVPSTAYNDKAPSAIGACDDVFAMPHADPKWDTHKNLIDWNRDFQGSIWYGCHAGSALENMFNPANPSEQANFLTEKTGIAVDAGVVGGYAENTLQLWKTHDNDNISRPFLYDYSTDPVMQFIGDQDDASNNGSERIYVPLSAGWRPTTRPGVYDDNHPFRVSNSVIHRVAPLAWGRGYGDPDNGWVLMQGGHDVGKENRPDFINAQRAFWNFSYLSMQDKVIPPSVTGIDFNTSIAPGEPLALAFTVPAPNSPTDFSITWTSSCGGTFSPSASSPNVTFTPPGTGGDNTCIVTVQIEDPCGRVFFDAVPVSIVCDLQITPTVNNICAGQGATGSIDMAFNYAGPYNYTWTRAGGGSGSGTGTSITSLAPGTYTVNVSAGNDCTASFTATVNEFPAINISATPGAVACFGESTGSIDLTVAGGTPAYTYAWNDGATSPNRSSIPAGNYSVTVTDVNGCTAQTSVTVTQPNSALSATPTVTNVPCFGESTGDITLAVSGGTMAYSYLWNDGVTTQNRPNIPAGTYSVTVTDANSCTVTLTNLTVTEPVDAVSLTSTQINANCSPTEGSITVTATGGTSPYAYDWSGTPAGDGTATITGLGGGTYAVTVTDDNGCTEVLSATITQAPPLAIVLTPTHPTCPPGADPPVNSDGEISLVVTGGTPNYTFAWTTSDGAGLAPAAQNQTGLSAGTYNVTVTDSNGCTISGSVALESENQLPVTPPVIDNN